MASTPPTLSQTNSQLKVTSPFATDALLVHSFSGTEGISKLFEYKVEMYSAEPSLDATTIIGKPLCVTVELPGSGRQPFHGLVTRFVQGGMGRYYAKYSAEVRPWFWMLTKTNDCRIFQNKSVPDIIQQIFSDGGYTDVQNSLQGTYTPRDYCVQYQESSFAFISRLMEEEGIFYFFTHSDSAHTLVLADDASSYGSCAGASPVRFIGGLDTDRWDDAVSECTVEHRVFSGKYKSDDYEFTTPATELLSEAEGTGDTKLSYYEYPGGYSKKDDGDTIVGRRLATFETNAKIIRGSSRCRGFHAGCKFTLSEHYRDDINAEYVITSMKVDATQDGYENTFDAIPSSVTFRPLQLTAKPSINGAQTATVVGKSGEEIWTDQYGRVKLKFHWDQSDAQDETASCWVRVAQPWAGTQWGGMFIPRIGQEVVVSFLDGNPDRPLVTGSVFNATNTVPYTLPDDQTKSTIKSNSSKGGSGFNEIRFEDKAGSEEVFLQAQKDMNVTVLNDYTTTITNNRTVTIQQKDDTLTVSQGKRSVTVSQGDESLTISQGKRTIDVTQGDETHSVGGKRTLTITGDEAHSNKAKFSQDVSGDFKLSVTGNLTIDVTGSVTIKSGQDFTNQSGGNLTNKATGNIDVNATGNLTNEGVQISAKAQASCQIESSGMLELKGSMTKIN